MLHRALKTWQWNFKKLSSTYYALCNPCQHWKELSLGKNHKSLAFSQVGRWKHPRSTTSASLSHRRGSSECFTILCQVLISWNTTLFQAHVVLVFSILFFFETSSSSWCCCITEYTLFTTAKLQGWNILTQCALLMGAAWDVTIVCAPQMKNARGRSVQAIPVRIRLADKCSHLRNSTYLTKKAKKKTSVSLFCPPII